MRYSEHLSNLDELVLRCRTEQSKEYISESILCYKVGAFRACIINTWVAVVFDLIEKIRELHNGGHSKATELYKKFERYQKQLEEGNNQGLKSALEFERNILDNVNRELEFFNRQELTDLKQLHQDRNKCGHPSYQSMELPYKPSAEQARLHLRNAVEHVLEEQPVQGKSALEELERLVLSDYFPKDIERASKQLKHSPLGNPSDTLIVAFIDKLMYGVIDDKESAYYMKKKVFFILNILMNMYYDTSKTRIVKNFKKFFNNISDDKYLYYIFFLLNIRDIFDNLNESSKHKIEEFFKKDELYEKDESLYIKSIVLGSKIESLLPIINNKVDNIDTISYLGRLISEGYYDAKLLKKAVKLYSNACNWDQANSLAINLIIPLTKYLTLEDIEIIISSPKENGSDLIGSFEFSNFLKKVIEEGIVTEEKLNELLSEYEHESFTLVQ